MLLSDDTRLISRGLVLSLALVCLGFLQACGFQPLYGERDTSNTTAHLAHIAILPIKDRLGQQLRNHLLTRLNPQGGPAEPLYELDVTLSQSVASLGVQKSAVVTRGNLYVTASYTLRKVVDEEAAIILSDEGEASLLTAGSIRAVSSYDISQEQYTVVAALKDARARAVKEIADDIKTRIAVHFRQDAGRSE